VQEVVRGKEEVVVEEVKERLGKKVVKEEEVEEGEVEKKEELVGKAEVEEKQKKRDGERGDEVEGGGPRRWDRNGVQREDRRTGGKAEDEKKKRGDGGCNTGITGTGCTKMRLKMCKRHMKRYRLHKMRKAEC
jgi:hypothetical protein